MRVVHWFPNQFKGGGVANSVLALASAQVSQGADVWVAALPEDGAGIYGPIDADVEIGVETWAGRWAVSVASLSMHALGLSDMRKLRALNPDVAHIHAEFNPDNWWVPLIWKCPLVLTPHGAFHPMVAARRARAKRLFGRAARPALWNRVRYFHALNPDELVDIHAALPDSDPYCVPQGPSPAVAKWVDGRRTPRATPSGQIRFMFIGRLDVQPKGLDILVRAMADVVARHRGTAPTLILVGPGSDSERERLMRLASSHGISELVELRGRVDSTSVVDVFSECDIYVQPSRNEGSPLSVNDALVLGKPTIMSDKVGTASISEIRRLPHVRVAAASPEGLADAMLASLATIDSWRDGADASLEPIRRLLSWDSAARSHLTQYEHATRGRSLRGP
jgi:glycosyltransferase involved in cell wall biosynthesis